MPIISIQVTSFSEKNINMNRIYNILCNCDREYKNVAWITDKKNQHIGDYRALTEFKKKYLHSFVDEKLFSCQRWNFTNLSLLYHNFNSKCSDKLLSFDPTVYFHN